MPMWQRTQRSLSYVQKADNFPVDHFDGLKMEDVAYVTRHSKHEIFSHVNISVKPGEKILLMAPSGWGKTTLLRLMLGIYKPSHGEIEINGEDVTGNWQKAHNYYSYVNQKPFILTTLSALTSPWAGKSTKSAFSWFAMKQA